MVVNFVPTVSADKQMTPDIRYTDETEMNTKRYSTCNGREWPHQWDFKMVPKLINGYMNRNNCDRKINDGPRARPTLLRLDSEGSCDSLSPPSDQGFDDCNGHNWEIGLNQGLNAISQSTKSLDVTNVTPFMAVVGLCGKSTFPPPFGSFCPRKPLVDTQEQHFGAIPSPFPPKNGYTSNGHLKMPDKLVKNLLDCSVHLKEKLCPSSQNVHQLLEPTRQEPIETKKPMVVHSEEKKPRTYASVVASGPQCTDSGKQKQTAKDLYKGPVQTIGSNGGKMRNNGTRCAPNQRKRQQPMEKCVSKTKKDMVRNKDKGNNEGLQNCKSNKKQQKRNSVLKCQGGSNGGSVEGAAPVSDVPKSSCSQDKGSSKGNHNNEKKKSECAVDKVQTAASKDEDGARVEENCRRLCLNSTIASILGWVTNLSDADDDSKSENEEWDNDSCDELDSFCSDFLWAHFKNNNRWELTTPTQKNGDTCLSAANTLAEVNRKWSEGIGTTSTKRQSPQKKNVRFAEPEKLLQVHPMIAWSFAYQSARKGPWEDMKRDRERFQQRIDNVQVEIASVLQPEHRKRVYAERFSDTRV